MATTSQNQKELPENLRMQLALAVRSIQWSYAIFWSFSSTQLGVLEWGDGYYNGDIKTRKTVQATEMSTDQLGLQRSDQLRELYESLSLGETTPQAKRPTASLSPEDLTDAEWYFLVCMSFVFNVDQGFPGKALAKNQPVWLCNAHRADTKVFSRSLLAKSASIQTIVCFPHLGGAVELGTTELVQEDPNLIQHIKSSFLENPSPTLSMIPINVFNNITNLNDCANMHENALDHLLDSPNVDLSSPSNCSDDFVDNVLIEESNLLQGVDGEPSQMHSYPFMDDAISNCLNNSMTSSDCISQTHEEPETIVPLSDGKKETNNTHECNQQKASGFQGDEVHYHSVLSNLLKNSHQLILGPYIGRGSRESSFVCWRRDGLPISRVANKGTAQKLLKKVLFEVPRMHERSRVESGKQNDKSRPEGDEIDKTHVLSERKRREKINERFMILGSLVPSGGKVDKVSILDHTIEYMRELERRVEELESYKESMELESGTRSKPQDATERTSGNYGPNKTGNNSKKPPSNKRKARDKDKIGAENSKIRLTDSTTDNISVSVADKDVLIEIRCSCKEHSLVEVMEAVSKLHLDTQNVQSSTTNGILSMTINAKCKGLKAASAVVIKQALQKVTRNFLK
ncbi:hypothetical protein ACS0TY_004262 [Phlomoides rotata]